MLELQSYHEMVNALKNYYGGDASTGQMVATVGHVLKKRGIHHNDRVNWGEAYADLISDHPRKFGFPDVSDIMKRINANIIQKKENYNTLTGQDIDGYWRCSTCRGKGGFLQDAKSKKSGQDYEGCVLCDKCHGSGYAEPGNGGSNEFVRIQGKDFDASLEDIRQTDPEAYAFILAIRKSKPRKKRKQL